MRLRLDSAKIVDMHINEITEIDKILTHLDQADHDNFCYAWYQGLDPYKENPHALLLMANAVLTHFEVPLYATGISWDPFTECFVWKFGKNTSPNHP